MLYLNSGGKMMKTLKGCTEWLGGIVLPKKGWRHRVQRFSFF
jgi:hypothetical protein